MLKMMNKEKQGKLPEQRFMKRGREGRGEERLKMVTIDEITRIYN
jgi:hypothetical protein